MWNTYPMIWLCYVKHLLCYRIDFPWKAETRQCRGLYLTYFKIGSYSASSRSSELPKKGCWKSTFRSRPLQIFCHPVMHFVNILPSSKFSLEPGLSFNTLFCILCTWHSDFWLLSYLTRLEARERNLIQLCFSAYGLISSIYISFQKQAKAKVVFPDQSCQFLNCSKNLTIKSAVFSWLKLKALWHPWSILHWAAFFYQLSLKNFGNLICIQLLVVVAQVHGCCCKMVRIFVHLSTKKILEISLWYNKVFFEVLYSMS